LLDALTSFFLCIFIALGGTRQELLRQHLSFARPAAFTVLHFNFYLLQASTSVLSKPKSGTELLCLELGGLQLASAYSHVVQYKLSQFLINLNLKLFFEP
jgi:hypothetical protein